MSPLAGHKKVGHCGCKTLCRRPTVASARSTQSCYPFGDLPLEEGGRSNARSPVQKEYGEKATGVLQTYQASFLTM
jgi:predicted metal-binding protein